MNGKNKPPQGEGPDEAASGDGAISTCRYAPQANKYIVPEHAVTSVPPVAAGVTGVRASSPVGWFSVPGMVDEEVLAAVLQLGGDSEQHPDEEALLQELVSVLSRVGGDMTPLLCVLRTRADESPRLERLARMLSEHLGREEQEGLPLSSRERDVIELAAAGHSNSAIAEILQLQTVTVGKALTRAYRKLKAKNRGEAVSKWLLGAGPRRG